MDSLKSDVFGIIIAFFIPGLTAFYGFTFFSPALEDIFLTFLTADSNIGLFLLVSLGGLAMGLQISVIRWAFFEKYVFKNSGISDKDIRRIWDNENNLATFRAIIDEHYRYHQFYGAMFFIVPLFSAGLIGKFWDAMSILAIIFLIIITIVITIANYYTAIGSYQKLIERTKKIEEKNV